MLIQAASPYPNCCPQVLMGAFSPQLGIQTYGFLPMKLPPDLNFSQTLHGADERIPVEAIDFGANAIYEAMQRFG